VTGEPHLELTAKLMKKIAKLPPRKKRSAMEYVSQMEWNRCANDIMYWLTPGAHFTTEEFPSGTPYVYTQERHTLYECIACGDGQLYDLKRRKIHLEFRHNLTVERHADIQLLFREASRKRVFNLLCYMPEIIEWWQREPILLLEKSRDMMATWLIVTLFTWDAIFHRDKQHCFQSETAVKTKELIERCYFLWNNQPAFLKNRHKAQFNSGTGRAGFLRIDSLGSEIIGMPQGADQIRQYHPSGVFSDEAAFQVEAGEMFTAIKPSIQNGGKYTAVSSANPGWFMLAAQDRLDDV
jgi:hypothetical protein